MDKWTIPIHDQREGLPVKDPKNEQEMQRTLDQCQ